MDTDILIELREIKRLLSLQKEMLSMDEFCQYTGISKNYAYHLTATNKIKYYKPFGKMIYFDKDEVIEFLKQNPVLDQNEKGKSVSKYILNNKNS